MKAWVHIENGIVVGAMRTDGDRDLLARKLCEWMMDGVTPVLHDFGDALILINAPLPLAQQADLFAPAILAALDNVAALNGGPLTINGHEYIAIRRQDWDALLAHRGTPDDVLRRLNAAA